MATTRQKRALDKIVEIGRTGGTKQQALIEAGYSPNTALAPTKVTESKGFKELCEERGLTEDFLVDALVEDIQNKPKNRKSELELGFKVIGRLSEQRESNKTLILVVSGETAGRYGVLPT